MTPRSISRRVIATALLLAAVSAYATNVTDNTEPYSALGTLRVEVVIGAFLRFQVGAAGAGISLVQFAPAAANVGDSSVIAGTGGGGAGPGQAAVLVQGNRNQITITPSNSSGGLGIGTGTAIDGRISYAQISTASSDAGNFPAPVLTDAGGAAVLPVLNATGITNRSAVWTYTYLNQTIPGSGTFGGVNLNGSRVTYTATMP